MVQNRPELFIRAMLGFSRGKECACNYQREFIRLTYMNRGWRILQWLSEGGRAGNFRTKGTKDADTRTSLNAWKPLQTCCWESAFNGKTIWYVMPETAQKQKLHPGK